MPRRFEPWFLSLGRSLRLVSTVASTLSGCSQSCRIQWSISKSKPNHKSSVASTICVLVQSVVVPPLSLLPQRIGGSHGIYKLHAMLASLGHQIIFLVTSLAL